MQDEPEHISSILGRVMKRFRLTCGCVVEFEETTRIVTFIEACSECQERLESSLEGAVEEDAGRLDGTPYPLQ